jgi:uncharacterized repeat protein (TIGR04076 family)
LKEKHVRFKYRVVAAVKEIRGHCPVYKVGDKIVFDGFFIDSEKSSNICIHAFSSMLSLLSAFIHGSSAESLGIGLGDVGYVQCPDPDASFTGGGTVVFELRRRKVKGG